MKRLWHSAMNFLENGDFLLAIILVSVAHYTAVLHRFDWWPVAAFLGFSVDLANYRAIKLYLKDKGGALMIVTSILSLAFHIAFYVMGNAGAWGILLGSAVPIAIFCMAYIAKVERLDAKAAKAATGATNVTTMARHDTTEKRQLSRSERLGAIRRVNLTRNGDGPMTAHQIVAEYGVSLRQAQRDVAAVAGVIDKEPVL